jgi:biopolymer transport protein ExbD
MKRNSPLVRQGSETDLDSAMTPMIDVVFLLLVFFVWTASFQIVEQILPTTMSAQLGSEQSDVQPPPEPQDFEDVVVKIGWDGQAVNWSINAQPLDSLKAVGAQLTTISQIQTEATVILHPQKIVPLGHVIEVYDVAKGVGFEKVSFAVNSQEK